jgi:hypothetical protein
MLVFNHSTRIFCFRACILLPHNRSLIVNIDRTFLRYHGKILSVEIITRNKLLRQSDLKPYE